jgi:hypothetical protein
MFILPIRESEATSVMHKEDALQLAQEMEAHSRALVITSFQFSQENGYSVTYVMGGGLPVTITSRDDWETRLDAQRHIDEIGAEFRERVKKAEQ